MQLNECVLVALRLPLHYCVHTLPLLQRSHQQLHAKPITAAPAAGGHM